MRLIPRLLLVYLITIFTTVFRFFRAFYDD